MRIVSTIALLFALLLTHVAAANDLETARVALNSGEYDQALAHATLLNDIDARLLAAEALNTKLLLGESDDDKADAKQAMAIGQNILNLDPNHKEAKLQYAISLGFYGRSLSPLSAWRKKMPQKIRARIETAVAANPDNPNSYALYGGWHMAVAAKAGTKTAKKMYNATAAEGIAYFEKALSAAPDDMMINGNYVMMLYASDAVLYDARVRDLLSHMQTLKPGNAAESHVLGLAQNLEANLDRPKKARKIAKKFLDW